MNRQQGERVEAMIEKGESLLSAFSRVLDAPGHNAEQALRNAMTDYQRAVRRYREVEEHDWDCSHDWHLLGDNSYRCLHCQEETAATPEPPR